MFAASLQGAYENHARSKARPQGSRREGKFLHQECSLREQAVQTLVLPWAFLLQFLPSLQELSLLCEDNSFGGLLRCQPENPLSPLRFSCFCVELGCPPMWVHLQAQPRPPDQGIFRRTLLEAMIASTPRRILWSDGERQTMVFTRPQFL